MLGFSDGVSDEVCVASDVGLGVIDPVAAPVGAPVPDVDGVGVPDSVGILVGDGVGFGDGVGGILLDKEYTTHGGFVFVSKTYSQHL